MPRSDSKCCLPPFVITSFRLFHRAGNMPVQWAIDHEKRLVRATVRGALTMADMRAYIREVMAAGGTSYAKLFDASQATTFLATEDLETAGKLIRDLAATNPGPIGPVAVVVGAAELHVQAEFFEDIACVDRPLRIFRDTASAQEWLEERRYH